MAEERRLGKASIPEMQHHFSSLSLEGKPSFHDEFSYHQRSQYMPSGTFYEQPNPEPSASSSVPQPEKGPMYVPPHRRSVGYQPTNLQTTKHSPKHMHQESSSKVRPVPSNSPSLPEIFSMLQEAAAMFGKSPLQSALYVPSLEKGRHYSGKALSQDTLNGPLPILSYNVWFREDLEINKRMEAFGNLVEYFSPVFICLQEVTPMIYDILKQSSWWKQYNCSLSDEIAYTRPYFCMQLSKLPVKSFSRKPFRNSRMGRELCVAEIEVKGKPLIIATTHLESPTPAPPTWDKMNSKERIAQAREALDILQNFPNAIFCGDMNWDEESDGKYPLPDGWVDAWQKLKPRDNGWTYDTKSNAMLSGNRPLQKRLDRFICHLPEFEMGAIDMIGVKPIPGLTYCKEKRVRNRIQKMVLPVLPSDHYGLLLYVSLAEDD